VQGTCIGENIEIHKHGEREGISRSDAFSIRSGGAFQRQAERLVVTEKSLSLE